MQLLWKKIEVDGLFLTRMKKAASIGCSCVFSVYAIGGSVAWREKGLRIRKSYCRWIRSIQSLDVGSKCSLELRSDKVMF